jgi:stearoyl-CoA desaturase (delta-9 desaturase)
MSTTVDPAARPSTPLVIDPVASARRTMRLIAGVTVIGPFVGTLLAAILASIYGVSVSALVIFAVSFPLTALGISAGFHRHFTHRGFRTSRAMSTLLLILGSMAMQGSLLYWVATHRRHHQFSDTQDDPHSPHYHGSAALGWWRGLWHAHIGWMFDSEVTNAMRFAPDIIRDPYMFRLQQRYLSWALLGLVLPALAGLLLTGTAYGMLEGFLWGGPVRLLIVHHANWAVGSLSHLYGRRPFRTDDHSANNMLVAIVSFGEGLQNNHHAFPTSARHALHWWEPDITGWVIGALERTRLIWDVKHPSAQAIAARRKTA